MYVPALWSDIRTRLLGDSTLTAIIGAAGVYNTIAPRNAALPYITFNIADNTSADSFTRAGGDVTFYLHAWAERFDDSEDGLATLANILARLHGNWQSKTFPTGPDYGIARWTPTLSGASWSASRVNQVRSVDQHERTAYHTINTYTVRLTATA